VIGAGGSSTGAGLSGGSRKTMTYRTGVLVAGLVCIPEIGVDQLELA
jgi:hypothetical protein